MSLTFDQLRAANVARLPNFKNSKGANAHTKDDGSDWSPALWFMAFIGEVGEWAENRVDWERGFISEEEFGEKNFRELADIQTYLDILSRRSMDIVSEKEDHLVPFEMPFEWQVMLFMNYFGRLCNLRKKYVRGDISKPDYHTQADMLLRNLQLCSAELFTRVLDRGEDTQEVVEAHPHGVDLGEATRLKFNEVSDRVGCGVKL